MEVFNQVIEFISIPAVTVVIANLVTMAIDESKVNSYIKPILKVLNAVALNVGKNKNATDK